MSGGRRTKLSPSLFPFLAVLICTLGTLILMLALVAQNASDTAMVVAEEQAVNREAAASETKAHHPALPAASVTSMIEDEQFRVTQLVSVRHQQTADLEERRDKIAHVEDHTRRLREELRQLNDEVNRATGETTSIAIEESQLAVLRRQIEKEKSEIEKIKAESGGRKPRVVIVPHKGPNGTDRRPVYLECTPEGLTILPERISITLDQLQRCDVGANPVESALRVIRHHALTTYGDAAAPYPLLIVRPNGIHAYAAARAAMKDYDDQFGYELVPDDVQLALAKPDTTLKPKIDSAVAHSISNQSRRASVASRNNVRKGHRLPVLSAASMDRQGRSSGFTRRGRHEQNLYTEQASDARSTARSYASRQSSVRSSDGTVSYGNSEHRSGPNANGGIDPALDQKWGEDMQDAIGEIRANGFDENGDPRSLLGDLTGDTTAIGSDSKNGDSKNGDFAEPESPSGQDSSNPMTSASQPGSANAGSSNAGPANAGPANPGPANPGPSSAGPTGAASSHGQCNNPSSSDPPPPGTDKASSQPPPNSHSQTPLGDLVNPSDKDWALPRDVAQSHGNSIVRTIRVVSHEDRFVLLPSSRGGAVEMFGVFNNDFPRSALELATAVRDRVDQWGVALPGGRWQPLLEVNVQPGGEDRFEQLQRLMQGSGVDVVPRPPLGQ